MRNKSITIIDIAKKCHVSPVTVSKALRDHPDISEKTTTKIKSVAITMGYSPNFMARNLAAKRSNLLGVVVPKISHSFFGSVIEAIYNTAGKYGYKVVLTVSQENTERECKHLETLMAMRVDGIIISVTENTTDCKVFAAAQNMHIPVVFMDRVPAIPDHCTVSIDDYSGAFKAVEHAISIGYKRFGHVGGYENLNIGKDRRQGFIDALKKNGLDINEKWMVTGGFGEKDGYNGFKKIYESGELPEIILAVTFPVALGIQIAVEEAGLKIPDDVDLICFGSTEMSKFMSPAISYIEQPTDLIGSKAVDLIVKLVSSTDKTFVEQIKIPTRIVLKDTCLKKNGGNAF